MKFKGYLTIGMPLTRWPEIKRRLNWQGLYKYFTIWNYLPFTIMYLKWITPDSRLLKSYYYYYFHIYNGRWLIYLWQNTNDLQHKVGGRYCKHGGTYEFTYMVQCDTISHKRNLLYVALTAADEFLEMWLDIHCSGRPAAIVMFPCHLLRRCLAVSGRW